jgi:hypothetical protein
MINMRDPALHNPTDYDETLTTSHAGYVSTFMLDDVSTFVLDDMVVTRNRSSPPLDAAWSVVFNWSHPSHIDLVYRRRVVWVEKGG